MSVATSVLERLVNAVNEEKLGAYGVHVLIGDDAVQHRRRTLNALIPGSKGTDSG